MHFRHFEFFSLKECPYPPGEFPNKGNGQEGRFLLNRSGRLRGERRFAWPDLFLFFVLLFVNKALLGEIVLPLFHLDEQTFYVLQKIDVQQVGIGRASQKTDTGGELGRKGLLRDEVVYGVFDPLCGKTDFLCQETVQILQFCCAAGEPDGCI